MTVNFDHRTNYNTAYSFCITIIVGYFNQSRGDPTNRPYNR